MEELTTPTDIVENAEMEDSDYEVVDTEVEDAEEQVVYEAPNPKPNKEQKKARAVSSAITASSEGKDPVQAYAESMYDPNNYSAIESTVANVKLSVSRLLGLASDVPPEQVATAIQDVSKRAQDGNLGPFYATVDAMPQAQALSKRERDSAAYHAWFNNKMAEVYDGMSVWDIGKDLFKTMYAPDNNFRMKDVADYLGIEWQGMDYVNTTEFQAKVTLAVGKLPVEARASLVQDLADRWETFGFVNNKLEMMNFLTRLVSFEETEQQWSNFENRMDRLDQAGITLGAAKVVKGIAKAGSIIRQLGRLKDVEGVRQASKMAMQGGLKELGVSPLDGAATHLPVSNLKKLLDGAPDGMAEDLLKMDKQLQRAIDDFDPLDLPLTDADKQKKMDKIIKEVDADPEVSNVRIKETDGKGFTLEMDTTTGVRNQKVNYTIDDVGSWSEAEQETRFGRWIWSPNFRLFSVRKDLSQAHFQGLLMGSKIRATVDDVAKNVLGSLKKTEMQRVDSLLLRGDGEERVFSYSEAVGNGIGGVRYTDKEYQAYLGVRQIYDTMHGMMNKRIIEQMKAQGVKKIAWEGGELAGKVYEDVNAAMRGLNQSRYSTRIAKSGKELLADAADEKVLSEWYGKGYKLVRNNDEFFSVGTSKAEYALVKAEDVVDPSGIVLNKRTGYVPKIREGANFFLKKKVKTKVGDKDVTVLTTERYSDRFSDLEDFRKGLDNPDDYVVMADRQLSSADLQQEQIRLHGGLFTGVRKREPIPFGVGEVEGTRKTALDSLQRYINSIASSMPLNVFREGLRQKWINSAVESGVLKKYTGREGFNEMKTLLDTTNPKARFFRDSHEEVAFLSGIKTDAENWASATVLAVGRVLENSKIPWGKNIAAMLYNAKHNPLDIMKSASYHMMLGMGNLSQVFIQGSGALVAMSVNPIHGIKGFEKALEFMVLDQMKHRPDVIAKLGGKVDQNAWKLWNESGMREIVTNSNLDYANIFNEVPYDAGLLRKALSKSDVFVNMGEMAYSRIAFGMAYDYAKKQLGRVPTTDDLPMIVARADDYRLNMTRANQSKFQKGLLAVPTQFMQVQTKFVEKIFGREFTGAEKTRLVLAQMGLYGSLGMPFFGTMTPVVLDFFGIDAMNTDSDKLRLYKSGAVGYLLNEKAGMNVEISGRMALGNDMTEKLFQVMFGEMGSLKELALGPSFTIVDKADNIVDRAVFAGSLMYHADTVDDKMLLAASKVVGQEILNVPASMRNAMKGFMMLNSGIYRNTAGQHIFEYRDANFQTAIGQLVGFQSQDVTDWYELGGNTKFLSDKRAQQSYAKMMATTVVKMLEAGAEEQAVYAAAYNLMRTSILNKKGGDEVHKQFINYLKNPKENWNSQITKALKTFQNEMAEGMDAIMAQSKIRTNVTLAKELEKVGMKEKN